MTVSFIVEKSWVSKVGYNCVAIANQLGHRCGYVGIPKNHSFYGYEYDNEKVYSSFQVHGGLTFSRPNVNYKGRYYPYPEPDDSWWFGFDCAHTHDIPDIDLAKKFPEKYEKMKNYFKRISRFSNKGLGYKRTVKDLDFVVSECEELSRQLKEKDAVTII